MPVLLTALASKMPLLTKSSKPKPRKKMPVSLAEKHSKAKTGKQSPEFGFAEFWSFVPLQRKTQFLWQNLIAKVLWHLKNSGLSNAVSQSPRIPLWHLKSHTLPKAPSQSLRIQLALNSDTDCRFQIRKHSIGGPGVLWHRKSPYLTKRREPKPPNSACAEFGKKNAGFKGENRRTVPEFGLRRILELLHKAVDKIGVSRRKSGNRQTIAKSAAFCSFGTRRLHKRGLFLCQNASPLKFDYF